MSNNAEAGIISLYSDVKATPIKWLWYPFFAIGKISLLQGDPGDGKSTMMLRLIAELSNGGATPDGQALGRPQRVLYQCSEDGVADTIKPRLEACGADCRNVAFINEELYSGLTLDDERLRQAIIEFRPRLVVIDPIQAYIGSDSDLQIAGRARKLMSRLGSIDVVAAARSVLQVERHSENADVRIVRQIKNSLGPSDGEIWFEINATTGFKWIETGKQINAPVTTQTVEEPQFQSKLEMAAYWIKKILENGDVLSQEVFLRLSELGIGRKTAEEAKKTLGIKSYRVMRRWYWSLENKTGESEGEVKHDGE